MRIAAPDHAAGIVGFWKLSETLFGRRQDASASFAGELSLEIISAVSVLPVFYSAWSHSLRSLVALVEVQGPTLLIRVALLDERLAFGT